MLLCKVEDEHTRPKIVIEPSRIMGGRYTNSFCSKFPKITHESMLYTTFNNVQKED
jgi:hypothetical protein